MIRKVCKRELCAKQFVAERQRLQYCSTLCAQMSQRERALESLAPRFWARVEQPDEGCWLWGGSRTPDGYGQLTVGALGGNVFAHRVAWMLESGQWPGALFVLHRCDNPPCVRPDHLFLGTATDNAQDALNKGRLDLSGLRLGPHTKPRAKLTPDEVRMIRIRLGYGVSRPLLAQQYRVSLGTIAAIARNEVWTDVG